MKSFVAAVALVLVASPVFAETRVLESLPESKTQIDVYRVSSSIELGGNKAKDITVRLISVDYGQSTDVSPRYHLFLTFFHGAEMSNSKTSFDLGPVMSVTGTRRLSAGVYEIQTIDGDLKSRKLVVDTAQVFIDDRALKNDSFEDPYFKSSIKITE